MYVWYVCMYVQVVWYLLGRLSQRARLQGSRVHRPMCVHAYDIGILSCVCVVQYGYDR